MLEYIIKFLMIFGIPLLLIIFATIILVNVVIVPYVKTGKAVKITENNVTIVDKRQLIKSNINGFVTEYYITFLFENREKLELKCNKSLYKKASIEDIGNIIYKPSVQIVNSFSVTKKSYNKTKGSIEASYLFTGNGVYRR